MDQQQQNNNGGAQQQDDGKLIFCKSHSVGTDKKGRNKLDLRFSEEETQAILAEFKKIDKRVKLQVHFEDGGTAFMFVKEVQPAGVKFGGGGSGARKPTTPAVSSSTSSKIAKLKAGEAIVE